MSLFAQRMIGCLIATIIAMAAGSTAGAEFPDRPIKIIVYTQPGGLIDVTARQFAENARRISGVPFVVENMAGAGGLIAMEHLLGLPRDGYTLLACTKTNIAKGVVTDREDLLDGLDWIGLLLIDPECLITRRDGPAHDWPALRENAFAQPGKQIWLGPGSGTMDHLMAIRVWEAFHVRGRWIPHGSGSRALAAVLGKQGEVYVGNPSDALEHDELNVVVVSNATRMSQWPNAPTFGELGHPELDSQFIWRGFALGDGVPENIRQWYGTLFDQVTADPAWRALWEPKGIQVVHLRGPEFTALTGQNREEFRQYLDKLHVALVPGNYWVRLLSHGALLSTIALGQLGVALWAMRREVPRFWRGRMIPLGVLATCIPLLAQTWRFPAAWEGVGAAAAPRLWLTLTAVCALLVMLFPADVAVRSKAVATHVDRVAKIGGLMLVQWYAAYLIGYFPATAIGMYGLLTMLGGTRHRVRIVVTIGWLLCAYGIFAQILHVGLPTGILLSQ